jgi:hemerythrin-like domain-containing protein
MREHGVVRRVMLLYDEAARRLDAGEDLPLGVVAEAADLVRRFIEDYHERSEEDLIFPRAEKGGTAPELIVTLRRQHEAGRRLTDQIRRLAGQGPPADAPARRALTDPLRAFVRMYGAHAAREDTVLFPALHGLLPEREYDALGEELEKREERLGKGNGFTGAIDAVAELERALGIDDLARFTPAP